MALTAFDTLVLTQHAAFCPPPLHIQKKPRRATFRRRVFRKSTHHRPNDQCVSGPLDDLIDEIKSDIWKSPSDYSTEATLFGWVNPFEVPSKWTVTPLPVSRLPSDQPLTIRKNREGRSSTSGSSMEDPLQFSYSSSYDDTFNGGPVGAPASTGMAPWLLFDAPMLYERPSNASDNPHLPSDRSAQRALEIVSTNMGDHPVPTKRRPSVLRLFTGLSRLRRIDTREMSGSSGDTSDLASPTPLEVHEEDENGGIAKRLASPVEYGYDDFDTQTMATCRNAPTTLRAAVNVFSEVTQLSQGEQQEFWLAVEIEGTLHNRVLLPDSTIDVIFVVDNAYYVSKECLSRALDAVNSALYHLDRGDRVALYATCCTRQYVTGNRPDLLLPIRPWGADTEETLRDLTATIAKWGTQSWKPPRPNPSMVEVILEVARSLKDKNLKKRRTHVVLLSPATHVLHDVSNFCPDLYIHQINPAAVPHQRPFITDELECGEGCCKNIFISNWSHYQSVPGRLKQILKYARSVNPIGEITKVCIDVRAKDGCEITECLGTKDIASLRLGQVHTIFTKVRVTRSATKAVDLQSQNPVFNSSLDAKDARQQLQNAVAVGAVKAHLLDVQVYHQNTLHGSDCWNYTENPFLVIRDLGGLAPSLDTATEVYKRLLFHKFSQLDVNAVEMEAETLLAPLGDNKEQLRKIVQRILGEVDHYQLVLEYEREEPCQRLPLCPGPITIEAYPHEWLVNVKDRKKAKGQGVAIVKEEEISGLINGLD